MHWTVQLCERELACTAARVEEKLGNVACEETVASRERFQQRAVVERLALESGCAVDAIAIEARSDIERGGQAAYRLVACGKKFICTSAPKGFDCKAALDVTAP